MVLELLYFNATEVYECVKKICSKIPTWLIKYKMMLRNILLCNITYFHHKKISKILTYSNTLVTEVNSVNIIFWATPLRVWYKQ
jgi:hypothetical protein